MDMLRHLQLRRGVPASTIQHQHDLFLWAGTHCCSKGGQFRLKERDGDGGREVEDGATRGGLDKADQIAPLEAMLHWRERPLAVETPDLLEDRLQANAVFVDGPEFDLGVGEGGGNRLDERTEVFLKAACALASACTWRGRGRRRTPPTRARYTQPT